ncbi:uncharacterized protein LOC143256226 isoform X2 [Tachypleus tridentatus]|uniref:uncharacterized protein LOC143256226 isoform X2 n=1 Tax=Tachypleus tridentatus TaxID=6853 RepID=UPI003FD09282
MATVRLEVEQVTFDAEALLAKEQPVKSFDSVIDPHTDFQIEKCYDVLEELSSHDLISNNTSSILQLVYNNTGSDDVSSSLQLVSHNTGSDDTSLHPLISNNTGIDEKKRNHVKKNRQATFSFRLDPKVLTPGSSPTPPEDQEINDGEETITNEENEMTSSKESDDEATQHFNKSHPELSAKTVDVFPMDTPSSLPSVKEETNSKVFKEPLFLTPFSAVTNTCEALSLQKSVIGDHCVKPVSAEIVAKVVASTKERLHNAFSSTSNPNSADNTECGKEVSRKGKLHRVPDGVIFNKLIRYPSETIETIFEKKSRLFHSSSSSVGENPSSSPLSSTPKKNLTKNDDTSFSRSRNNSQSSTVSIDSRKLEMAGTHTGKKQVSDEVFDKLENERMNPSECTLFIEQPWTEAERKKLDFVVSDKVDLDSLCSESVETESNISSITGIEEEMSCVKKLLIDVPSSRSSFPVGGYGTESSFLIRKNPVEQQTVAVETQPPELQDQETETDSLEYFGILCENATLQGQVDTLRNEIGCVMKDKVQLQGLIASLESRIKLELEDKKVGSKEKQEILREFEKISKEHRGWSNVIAEYQSVIDSKIAEIKGLKEDISESELERTKLKVNLEETKIDLESKDGAIDGLKKKIAELHVEVLTLLQGKVQLENEVKGVRGEMETLRKSKEWYQQQLNSVQDNRNTIHQELIKVQAEVVSSNNLLEQKKLENKHLKQQLIESQQKAMREKEILMKHLENIEMDIVERESLFQEIQKDRGAAEESLTERMKKLEEEQSNINKLNFTVNELKHQLAVAKNNLSSKDEIIHKFEKDLSELAKQAVFYEKTVNEKDLSHQWVEQQLKDSEQKLTHTELELSTYEEQIKILKEEKTAVEIALAAANEEKRTVNETLLGLKENLNRVEGAFRQMRTEFVAKSALVEQLQKRKNCMEDVLEKTEEKYLQQKHEFELKSTSADQKIAIILQDMQSQRNELENVLEATKKELLINQKSYFVMVQEKDELQRQSEEMTKSLHSSEEKIKSLTEENSRLTVTLTDLQELSEVNNLPQAIKEKYQMTGTTTDVVSGRLDETYKLHQLEETLKTKQEEFGKKQKMYESNIKVLTRKLKESMKARKKAEQDLLKDRRDKAHHTIDAEQQTHEDDINKQGVIEHVAHEKLKGETNPDDYRKKEVDLEEQLTVINKKSDEWKLCADKRQEFILELEKEKGQLTESLATIKQHMTGVEAQLMEKQTELSELNHQMKLLEKHQKEETVRFQKKLASVEQELNKEKSITKELRRQVFQDKRENSHLGKTMTNIKSNLEKTNQIADARRQEILTLQSELNVKHQAELKHRAEMESLQTVYKQTQAEVKQLKQEMEEQAARDPALADQIKTLSWHLKERNQELSALKEQICAGETRHRKELEELGRQIQITDKELNVLKTELANTRKEKFGYQTKVAELRNALKSSLDRNKELQTQLDSKTKPPENGLTKNANRLNIPPPASPPPYDDTFITVLLEQSAVLPVSKPLSNLQTCLNALKQEMAILQKQLEEEAEMITDL